LVTRNGAAFSRTPKRALVTPRSNFIYLGGAGVGNIRSDAALTNILANTTYTLTLALGTRLDYLADRGSGIDNVVFQFEANGNAIPGTQGGIDPALVPVGTSGITRLPSPPARLAR